MKYRVTLVDTASSYDTEERRVSGVIEVAENEDAFEEATAYCMKRGLEDDRNYLVVNIERGEN